MRCFPGSATVLWALMWGGGSSDQGGCVVGLRGGAEALRVQGLALQRRHMWLMLIPPPPPTHEGAWSVVILAACIKKGCDGSWCLCR